MLAVSVSSQETWASTDSQHLSGGVGSCRLTLSANVGSCQLVLGGFGSGQLI